jgi:redox-sensing transcriptional repressor
VIRRLTNYLAYAQDLKGGDVGWSSSKEIADQLGLTSSTVRQDLMYVDYSGRSKRGYETARLKAVIEHLLGADKQWKAVVIGAGNLGRALALHEEFGRRGFTICGLFDADPAKVGRRCGRLTVQDMDKAPSTIGALQVDVGVIAVPAAAAQRVADLLIAAGVRGLLNMSPSHIVAPRRVAVVDARILSSLQELAHAILVRQAAGAARDPGPKGARRVGPRAMQARAGGTRRRGPLSPIRRARTPGS